MGDTHLANAYDGDDLVAKIYDSAFVKQLGDTRWCTIEKVEDDT